MPMRQTLIPQFPGSEITINNNMDAQTLVKRAPVSPSFELIHGHGTSNWHLFRNLAVQNVK